MARIDSTGLTIRRYPEIVETIRNSMRTGISADLIFDEDTILGQMVNILSLEIATLEEVIQVLNDSKDRDKAEDEQLDSLLYLVGLERILAAKSSGFVEFLVNNGITIPFGTLVENSSTGDRFEASSSITATPSNCLEIIYSISSVQNSTLYSITVNGSDYTYTSDATATGAEIVAGLVASIEAAGSSAYEASIYVNNGTDYLKIASKTNSNISTSVVQYLQPYRVKIRVPFAATVTGSIKAPAYSIDKLVTGVGGVYSISNPDEFGVGRDTETNTEFRTRATQSLAVAGSATYSAVYNALTNIDGVSSVILLENNSGVTDSNGLPPKSFEAILDIPDGDTYDQAVAEVLWDEKPIGIETYGIVNGGLGIDYVDELGITRTLKFSRPTYKHIAVKVEYTIYDEEILTDNISDVIKSSVIDYGQSLTSGVDVIPKRFIGKVYAATDGLDNVTVYAQELSNAGDAPVELDWSEDKISIDPRETASFIISDVYVEAV